MYGQIWSKPSPQMGSVYDFTVLHSYTPPKPGSCIHEGAGAALYGGNNYEKFWSHWLQQLQYTLLHRVLFQKKKIFLPQNNFEIMNFRSIVRQSTLTIDNKKTILCYIQQKKDGSNWRMEAWLVSKYKSLRLLMIIDADDNDDSVVAQLTCLSYLVFISV